MIGKIIKFPIQFVLTVSDFKGDVWVKIQTDDIEKTVVELWSMSIPKEFVIIHTESKRVWAVFSEENTYEIHEGYW